MKLFMLSLIAAAVSGYFAWRSNKHRALNVVSFIVSVAVVLMSGSRLIPESFWMMYMQYMFGTLLVLGFWMIRTHVRSALLK